MIKNSLHIHIIWADIGMVFLTQQFAWKKSSVYSELALLLSACLAQMHGFPQRWWHYYEICMTRSTCIQCVKRRSRRRGQPWLASCCHCAPSSGLEDRYRRNAHLNQHLEFLQTHRRLKRSHACVCARIAHLEPLASTQSMHSFNRQKKY